MIDPTNLSTKYKDRLTHEDVERIRAFSYNGYITKKTLNTNVLKAYVVNGRSPEEIARKYRVPYGRCENLVMKYLEGGIDYAITPQYRGSSGSIFYKSRKIGFFTQEQKDEIADAFNRTCSDGFYDTEGKQRLLALKLRADGKKKVEIASILGRSVAICNRVEMVYFERGINDPFFYSNRKVEGNFHGMETGGKVAVYKLDFYTLEILARYDSISEAARENGLPYNGIWNCIAHASRTAGGYIWVSDPNDIGQARGFNGEKLYQLDPLTLNTIAEYNTIYDAVRKTGILITPIRGCLEGKHHVGGGYVWTTDKDYAKYNSGKRNYVKNLPVYQFDKETKRLIAKYDTIRLAEKATRISYAAINSVVRGVYETAGGYRWSRYPKI